VGLALQRALPRIIDDPYQVSNGGRVRLDSRRQAIQDQWMMQINPSGKFGIRTYGFVPNVDQTFGGTFGPNKPAPGRNFPPCVKKKLPWQGKIKVVANGKVTNQIVRP
jgi:branched-chain amino acid transport system substrate-binding protein